MRTWPSPDSPKPIPGVITTPWLSTNSSANSTDVRSMEKRGNTKVAPCGSGHWTPSTALSLSTTAVASPAHSARQSSIWSWGPVTAAMPAIWIKGETKLAVCS